MSKGKDTVSSGFRIGLAITAMLLLAGCGESGRIFGFDRRGPDEFTVVRNPPLSVPPEVSLRPPTDGTAAQTRDLSQTRAQDSLLASGRADGEALPTAYSASGQSPGEVALAQRAGAYYGVEGNIRQTVDTESLELAKESESLTYTVLFWQTPPTPGTPVDAAAEARRLQQNAALGLPADTGASPMIVRRKSTVDSLF